MKNRQKQKELLVCQVCFKCGSQESSNILPVPYGWLRQFVWNEDFLAPLQLSGSFSIVVRVPSDHSYLWVY